jgi:carbamoyl-phosphate synthase small subunit
MRAMITDIGRSSEEAVDMIRKTPVPHDAVARVSCQKRWYARTADPMFNVVAIDCGIKLNIVRSLNHFGCNLTVVPYDTSAEADLLYSLIIKAKFENNRYQKPKKKTKFSTQHVDWY